jgi:hypothetical protein
VKPSINPLASLANSKGEPSWPRKQVSKVVADKPSNLFRRLTTVLLVNATEFARATTKAQTALIAEAGLPVEFVTDFFDLGNKRIIRDKLLAGTDVSRELEFNGVMLSPEEIRAFDLMF